MITSGEYSDYQPEMVGKVIRPFKVLDLANIKTNLCSYLVNEGFVEEIVVHEINVFERYSKRHFETSKLEPVNDQKY